MASDLKHLEGKRIRLLSMPDDPCPIPPGTTGRIFMIGTTMNGRTQIYVNWDIDRSLILIHPVDQFEIITEEP